MQTIIKIGPENIQNILNYKGYAQKGSKLLIEMALITIKVLKLEGFKMLAFLFGVYKNRTPPKRGVSCFWWNSEGSRTSGKENMPVACFPAQA